MTSPGYIAGNKNILKSSGTPNLFFNSRENLFFERNPDNIAYLVSGTQLPSMIGGSLLDLYLSRGHMREPHWHPNAWELDVIVSGEARISIVDPDNQTLKSYHAKVGDVVFIPMGWLHWIEPVTEKVHLHLFFNNDQVEIAEMSDQLQLIPPEVFVKAYALNEQAIKEALAPLTQSVIIGPPTPIAREAESEAAPALEDIQVKINHKLISKLE